MQVGIASRDVVTEDGSPATELAAKAPSACRAWPLLEAAPGELYRVHLEAQAVSGSVPRYCLFARGPNICVALPLPVVANGWQITEGLVRLPAGTIDAALYFYADSPKEAWPLSTVVRYRPAQVTRLLPTVSSTVDPLEPAIAKVDLAAGELDLSVDDRLATPRLGSWSGVADCNKQDDRSPAEVGLSAASTGQGDSLTVQLNAQDHAACVWAALADVVPGARYRVAVDYRTLSGRPPRLCVNDREAGGCIDLRPLEGTPKRLTDSSAWQAASYELTVPRTNQIDKGLRLYVYADGVDPGTTTEYRNARIATIHDDRVTVLSAVPNASEPVDIAWRRKLASKYDVDVADAPGRFVLALSDAYDPEWKLAGLPQGATGTHVKLDGYRNGWVINAEGPLHLTLSYTPYRWARLALSLSVAAALGCAIFLVIARVRRVSPAS